MLHLLELQTVRRGRLPDTLIPQEPVTHPVIWPYLLPGGLDRRETEQPPIVQQAASASGHQGRQNDSLTHHLQLRKPAPCSVRARQQNG